MLFQSQTQNKTPYYEDNSMPARPSKISIPYSLLFVAHIQYILNTLLPPSFFYVYISIIQLVYGASPSNVHSVHYSMTWSPSVTVVIQERCWVGLLGTKTSSGLVTDTLTQSLQGSHTLPPRNWFSQVMFLDSISNWLLNFMWSHNQLQCMQ